MWDVREEKEEGEGEEEDVNEMKLATLYTENEPARNTLAKDGTFNSIN